jgi:phage I-like protein
MKTKQIPEILILLICGDRGCRKSADKKIAINHDVTPEEIAFGTAVNVSPIDEAQDEWTQITPYGEYPNEYGTQVVNKEYAQDVVDAHNSLLGKLGRLFRGVPVYRGHPDARPDIWPDDRRYGRYNALEARNDGLYGKPAWNSLGTENIKEGFYVYPSPAWHFKSLGDGKIAPTRLVSVGLTNLPNIREVAPLTNSVSATTAKSEHPPTHKATEDSSSKALATEDKPTLTKEQIAVNEEQKKKLCEALGLDPANTTPEQLIIAMNTLKTERDTATNAEKNPLVIAANATKTKAESDKDVAVNEAKKFKKLAIDHELDLAINDGRLTAAEKPQWATKFETDFDAAATELKEKQPALNTKGLNLRPNGKDLSDASKRRIAFNARLDELMQQDRDGRSLSIDQAIAKMRSNPEDNALLEAMQQPIAA